MRKYILFTVILLFASDAFAGSIRCGRKIVKPGDSGNTLIKKCGNPVRKYSSKETVNENGRQSNATVSNWVYQRTGKKDMVVSVRNGAVIKIQVE